MSAFTGWGRLQLNRWPWRVPLSLYWLNTEPGIVTSLIQDPLLWFQSCESRSYFQQKGMEPPFSVHLKCTEQSKVAERGQLLFKPQERQTRRNERKIKYQKIELKQHVWHFKCKLSPHSYITIAFVVITQCMITHSLISFSEAPEELEKPYCRMHLSLLEHSFVFSKAHGPAFCWSQSKLFKREQNGWRLTFSRAAARFRWHYYKFFGWLTLKKKKKSQVLANNSQNYLIFIFFFFKSAP